MKNGEGSCASRRTSLLNLTPHVGGDLHAYVHMLAPTYYSASLTFGVLKSVSYGIKVAQRIGFFLHRPMCAFVFHLSVKGSRAFRL